MQALDANMIGGIAPPTREVLQRVAVVGSSFDTDEFVALSGLPEDEAFDHLDAPSPRCSSSPTSTGYRFRHGLVRDALLDDVPPHRRRRIHRDAAEPADRAATRRRPGSATTSCESGAAADAVPYLLRAAETEAAVGAYRDALALVDAVRPHATGSAPGDGAVAARRPAQRDRRPDGRVGLPGGARRVRPERPPRSCASGSLAAR